MAHQEQKEFFMRLRQSLTSHFTEATRVLEVGSQDINGTVRGFFPNAREYLGIDLGIAKCVDWVIPGELIELPNGWADVTVSTECFEHCRKWDQVMTNMIRITKPHGLLVITCASIGRATHGTIDSDTLSSPYTTDYYKNLSITDISEKILLGHYFSSHGFEVNSESGDLYFWGIRSKSLVNEIEGYWEAPMTRLARAQGQLAQAAARHSEIRAALESFRTGSEQIRHEANRAKAEADQARAEANLARAEADQLKAANERYKSDIQAVYSSNIWRLTRGIRKIKDILTRKPGVND
jgi:hypothetical protein